MAADIPPSVKEAADALSDWQTALVFVIGGAFGGMGLVWRSVKAWARRMSERSDTQISELGGRVSALERDAHATALRIVALESLSREVDSIGRRVDQGFESVTERLDDIAGRCFSFHTKT